jgi:hypothetical protein
MKIFLSVMAIAVLAWFAFYQESPLEESPVSATPVDPPTQTLIDPAEVFQRALWKRPTAQDNILHAERREWADADGIQKWQWFLKIEPSPELVSHLRVKNAFGLQQEVSPKNVAHPPEWFTFDQQNFEVMGAGNMRLYFSPHNKILYATDSGGGFHAGAPEPERPIAGEATATGRLPLTPPPTP